MKMAVCNIIHISCTYERDLEPYQQDEVGRISHCDLMTQDVMQGSEVKCVTARQHTQIYYLSFYVAEILTH